MVRALLHFRALCVIHEGRSILYDKGYDEMADFDMDKLWNELVTHHSFLVDVFNVASNQFCMANETPLQLRTKYCPMYSTLTMVRWDHLSLLQRINTVLMIEGGGSVRVCFALHKFVISLVFFDVKLKYSMKIQGKKVWKVLKQF